MAITGASPPPPPYDPPVPPTLEPRPPDPAWSEFFALLGRGSKKAAMSFSFIRLRPRGLRLARRVARRHFRRVPTDDECHEVFMAAFTDLCRYIAQDKWPGTVEPTRVLWIRMLNHFKREWDSWGKRAQPLSDLGETLHATPDPRPLPDAAASEPDHQLRRDVGLWLAERASHVDEADCGGRTRPGKRNSREKLDSDRRLMDVALTGLDGLQASIALDITHSNYRQRKQRILKEFGRWLMGRIGPQGE